MTSTSQPQKTVFLVGPGFIGGTLLVRLKEARPDLKLSALTRRDEQVRELEAMGITAVRGTLEDDEVIRTHAAQADIVLHTATADDKTSAMAIVEGLKARGDKARRKAVYIHTSGNDELVSSAKQLKGQSAAARTLSDAQGDDVLETDRIDPQAYHRHVDGPLRRELVNDTAEKEHNVSASIMMPPLIYGLGAEPWRRHSIQVPMLTECMVDKGAITLPPDHGGCWNGVWVHDLVDAYVLLLKELEAHTPGTPHPSHYCFPAEPKPFLWKDVLDAIHDEVQQAASDPQKHTSAPPRIVTDRKTFETFVGGDQNPYAPCFGAIVFGDDNSYTKPE